MHSNRVGVLQSARESAGFRIHADGQEYANEFQATRTAAFGVKVDGKFYIMFDCDPHPLKNIILARAQEGYDKNHAGEEWTLPATDPFVAQALRRAEKDGRVVAAPEHSSIVLPTAKETQYFGNNGTVQEVIGDQAAGFAANLLQVGRNVGKVHLFTASDLTRILGRNEDSVVIRPVGLGDDIYFISVIYANDRFNDSGHARGVSPAQHFSRGTQGTLEEIVK